MLLFHAARLFRLELRLEIVELVAEILADLRVRYSALNGHYEAGWTDSFCHRRCEHAHQTLIDAAKCGSAQGCGWYVFAVDLEEPRELTQAEDRVVNDFRFEKISAS